MSTTRLPPSSAHAAPPVRGAARWRRPVAWALAMAALAAVFASYLRPDFVVALATRAWSCF